MDMLTDENDYSDAGLRWQSSAILALQEATEAYLVHLFEDASVSVFLSRARPTNPVRYQKLMRHPRKKSYYHDARYTARSTNTRAMGWPGMILLYDSHIVVALHLLIQRFLFN